MLSRPKFLSLVAGAALTALPSLAHGQILFSDSNFLASNYTASVGGEVAGFNTDIRYNLDYSSFSIFDGYLNVAIPPSPRGGGTTTGLFLTGNNDSIPPAIASAIKAAVTPNGVSVGTGTLNPNYVMRVDVFNSTGNGIDNGSGTIGSNGQLTTYSYVGLNQANTTVQVRNIDAPGPTGSQPNQGLGLLITADGGAGDDFLPVYGGAVYQDRGLTEIAGQTYSQTSHPNVDTGLLGKKLNNYWQTQGFEFNAVTPAVNDNLNRSTGDGKFFAPDPANLAGYLANGTGADLSPYNDVFPKHNDPLHFSLSTPITPAFPAPNETAVPVASGGVPYNKWATHELYWVDGTFTYVVTYDGVTVPLLQITPDADGLDGDDNIYSAFSSSGAPVLGYYDRFSSVAVGPEGANFVVYDNLEIEVADAGDVPDMMQYLIDNGYTIPDESTPGDLNGDGAVTGLDFLDWQRGVTTPAFDSAKLAEWQGAYNGGLLSAVAVPEPSSVLLVVGMAGCGLLGRRRA